MAICFFFNNNHGKWCNDPKRQQTCVEQIFMLTLKNYFVSQITRMLKLLDNPTGY